jgi:hypothetical protein
MHQRSLKVSKQKQVLHCDICEMKKGSEIVKTRTVAFPVWGMGGMR